MNNTQNVNTFKLRRGYIPTKMVEKSGSDIIRYYKGCSDIIQTSLTDPIGTSLIGWLKVVARGENTRNLLYMRVE